MKRIWMALGMWLMALPAVALNVVATNLPAHSLTSAVMQDIGLPYILERRVVMDHDGYTLNANEAKLLANADVVFWLSPDIETYMPKALDTIAKKKIVSIPLVQKTPKLKRLQTADGSALDEHVWLDPRNAIRMLNYISKVLSDLDPVNKDRYVANTKKWISRINEMQTYRSPKNVNAPPVIVATQDGWQYLFGYLGLQNTFVMPMDFDELPGPNALRDFQNKLRDLKPDCIIVDPYAKDRSVQNGLGGSYKTVGLESMGKWTPSSPGHYTLVMNGAIFQIYQCAGYPRAQNVTTHNINEGESVGYDALLEEETYKNE